MVNVALAGRSRRPQRRLMDVVKEDMQGLGEAEEGVRTG